VIEQNCSDNSSDNVASIGQVVFEMEGCHLLTPHVTRDLRGSFSKVLSAQMQLDFGIRFIPRELFWSSSSHGVIRGMHLQLPPHAGTKLVWVSHGVIRDVIIDCRIPSQTYGSCFVNELSELSGGLYIPVGCAHGYEVLSNTAVVNYAQDVDYDPEFDSGIAWDSFNFSWITEHPILSERDLKHPTFEKFVSPFTDAV